MMLVDSFIVILILLISFSLRLGEWFWPEQDILWTIIFAPILAVPIFISLGLYRTVIRFIGFQELWVVFQAVSLYALLWGIIGFMGSIEGIPRSVIIINWLLLILALTAIRTTAKWLFLTLANNKNLSLKSVLIYGAGSAGRQLSRALQQSSEYRPVALIDDLIEIQNQTINGLKVISIKNLEELIIRKNITEVFLAIPSLSRKRRSEIIEFLEPLPVIVRSLPSVSDLAQGRVEIEDLRKINIKDILGRESIAPRYSLLETKITNKVVLVSGAGGSIGSELSRQIYSLKPHKLILFELSEFSLYHIEQELKLFEQDDVEVFPILGSVRDQTKLENICKHFKVQTIYHAAAYKHVPLVEFNQAEGVLNNVIGTLSAAQAAIEAKVETFVLISTDKAVRPTNVMGATKRVSELILQALAQKTTKTCFTMVRFGNVLESSGSVIPLFKKQIKGGGPITVTDKNIVRYFMTIPEAVQLVIQAGAMGSGGDVFLLDMGKPIKINDLAVKMIQLSGLQVKDKDHPNGDIEIKYTGLRPGEKLFEELLVGDDVIKTEHPLIMRAEEELIDWLVLEPIVNKLYEASKNADFREIRRILIKVVAGYSPQSGINDFLFKKNE
jgi:FlaA1/EpsC-like NDP-sugar epimerase